MTYDVLNERWVPVENLTGHHLKTSPLELLETSHTLRRISTGKAIYDSAIEIFFKVFLMDAMRNREYDEENECYREWIEQEKIYGQQRFMPQDMQKIHDYVEECSKTMSWDAFDEEKPFMQIWGKENEIKEEKLPVTYIGLEYETGTTPLFYHTTPEKERIMSKEEFVMNLCVYFRYIVASGRGWKSSVYGNELVNYSVEGENLFQTLWLGIIPDPGTTQVKSVTGRSVYGTPFWRKMDQIHSKEAYDSSKLDTLDYLTFVTRMYRGGLDENGNVNYVYQVHGFLPKDTNDQFIGGILCDPYKYYKKENKASSRYIPITEESDGSMWTAIDSLMTDRNGACYKDPKFTCYKAKAVECAEKLLGDKDIDLVIFTTEHDKRKMISDTRHSFHLPRDLLSGDTDEAFNLREQVVDAVKSAKLMTEYSTYAAHRLKISKKVSSASYAQLKAHVSMKQDKTLSTDLAQLRYTCSSEFVAFLDRISTENIQTAKTELLEAIKAKCLDTFDSAANSTFYKPEEKITKVIPCRILLESKLNSFIPKGEKT